MTCEEFSTLGFQVGAWIQSRCVIPDGDHVGEAYALTGEMWRFLLRHYRVDPFARFNRQARRWILPFVYARGSQLTRPQKWGKGPLAAAVICAEAAPDGAVRFDGWDAEGQPVGRPWATPLIQVTAASEDQSENVWGALLPMIERGVLSAVIPDTGLTRIFLPSGGRIEPTSASALSRLGQRVVLAVQDQTESWTRSNGLRRLADTQRRNLAGMGGRWLSTCNAWDPREESVAQHTSEHERDGVWHDDVEPGSGSVRNKAERRRMLRAVYGDSWWVDLDRVDAEIVALLDRDPAQAERWLLNRKRASEDAAFDVELWRSLEQSREVMPGALIVLGVDGARFEDALAIRARDVETGHAWTVGIWQRPELAPADYEHPFEEIDGAMIEVFDTWKVWRAYIDPQHITHLVERWQGRWGSERVVPWWTNRPRQIAWAVRSYIDEFADFTHDPDPLMDEHVGNSRRQMLNVYDDRRQRMHTLAKEFPQSPRKIDGAMADVLSHEARRDAIAAGALRARSNRAVFV
jgi:hypothetical protein